ncbi:hypothetical protein BW731_02125 [Vagococcus martis]|uniref:DUF4279 domain-containing protein n=1 Tax=Vagococcus martis TaxID=1768210 RepID=A0A1V4DF25_9ENTE|nr:hypothetical protein [Vagococcus martis]OPF87085.1 hypothetical protein BW731_02125 [Vagococcus martis]
MSYEIDICCHVSGNDFSPNKAEKLIELKFENKIEVGDLILIGKFKDTLSIIGSASLSPFSNQDKFSDDYLINFIELLSENIDILKSCGVQNFDLSLGIFYKDQCNFSFSSQIIKLLNQTGLTLNISCFQIEN